MLNFEKPIYKITDYIEKNNYGKFELEPLERGYGITLGNALRRVMLSSMPGSAIVAVRIEGVMHEFQAMEGIVEDVTTIVLNLKKFNQQEHVIKTRIIMQTTKILYGTSNGIEKKHVEDIIKLCGNNIGNKFLMPNKNYKISVKGGKVSFEKLSY